MKNAIQLFKQQLTNLNYSQRTVHNYVTVVERMCNYCNKKPHLITELDYKAFVNYMVNETNLSWNTIHLYHCGISYFFREILKKNDYKQYIKYPKRIRKLPVVLSYSEVRQIFNQVTNFKHNTILKILYSTGIRLAELRFLTLDCVDFERRTILIKGGKGRKDRYVAISFVMREQLIEYLEQYKPGLYLFETNKTNKAYTPEGVRFIILQAKRKLNIKKRINVHCFRHSFATHMLEQGGNILVLQRLLGHANLNATLVYLHVQNVDITRAPNPLDNLEITNDYNYIKSA
jgi:integrase/recombinase XerD